MNTSTTPKQLKLQFLTPDEIRINTFKDELDLIENPHCRRLVEECLCRCDVGFFQISASSTDKYHPPFAQGQGGLIRHTKAVVQVALDLLRCGQFSLTPSEYAPFRYLIPQIKNSKHTYQFIQDDIIAACILHDICKRGRFYTQYTNSNHASIAVDFIHDLATAEVMGDEWQYDTDNILNMVRYHMGIWSTPKDRAPINDRYILLVHLADYIASRKYISESILSGEKRND